MKRVQGFGFVNMHEGIITPGKGCRNIITATFKFRMIYHSDRAVTAYLLELVGSPFQIEDQELILARVVEDILPTACAPFRDFHFFHRRAPLLRGNNTSMIGAKPHKHNAILSMQLACQLTNIEHASTSHIG